jgi:GPH family glycoside/pentoside/hexuronide:cation symporter
MGAFISYAITFGIISIMSPSPSPWLYIGLVLIATPFAQAAFGILPVVVASDNAIYSKHETGEDMNGMFMAVSGFFRKLGSTIATILFTSFLVLGKDIGDDMGIRVAVIFAGVLSIIGLLIMSSYNEKEVMKYEKVE